MTGPTPADTHTPSRHRLELVEVELIGGRPPISLNPGFNLIHGDQTTGKTTLVRLIRAMLGSMPKKLPLEVVAQVTAIRGRVYLGPNALAESIGHVPRPPRRLLKSARRAPRRTANPSLSACRSKAGRAPTACFCSTNSASQLSTYRRAAKRPMAPPIQSR